MAIYFNFYVENKKQEHLTVETRKYRLYQWNVMMESCLLDNILYLRSRITIMCMCVCVVHFVALPQIKPVKCIT